MIELRCTLARGAFELALETVIDAPSTGVFGPSGAGKSSLLHALAGLVPARELRLVVAGETLVDTAAGLAPPVHRRRMGLVFQDHRLFPHLSVASNLRYGLPRDGRRGPAFDEVVELLEVTELLARRPDQCSGGQRQRVALGRALLSAPRLLLLDEPLASLDRPLKRQILPYLRRARNHFDIPLLMVSHDLRELLALADHLLLLDGGRLRGSGSVADLCADPSTLGLLHDQGLVFLQRGSVRETSAGSTRVRLDGPAGLELLCAASPLPVGTAVELLIEPEDLLLARGSLPAQLSARNRFPARIGAVTVAPERCLLRLDAGTSHPFLAEVAPATLGDLSLVPGAALTVLCKAQAIELRAAT